MLYNILFRAAESWYKYCGPRASKISILIHALTHNMTQQQATRLLHRTSLTNQVIIIA